MQNLKISIVQTDLEWENREKNLFNLDQKLSIIPRETDLILLPEMFNSGFTTNVKKCSEKMGGPTMKWMEEKAIEQNSVVAGSLLISEKGSFFNRFVWINPEGNCEFYDKRHLFSMAGEDKIMQAGIQQKIVHLKGWKIALQVCYDLRFPAWSKNAYSENNYAYDILIYIANWPEIRKQAYLQLLPARAIENQAFVVWVNRVGLDGNNINHSGDSSFYDPLGKEMAKANSGAQQVLNTVLSYEELNLRRSKFLIGPDWDSIQIIR